MDERSPTESESGSDGILAKRRKNPVRRDLPEAERGHANLSRVLGAMLRTAREVQRLSQDQVADLTNGEVSRTTISSIERGQILPGLEALVSLSGVLNVEPLEVLERVRLANAVPVDVTGLSWDELNARAEGFFWAGNYRSALAVYDAMFDRTLLDPAEDLSVRARCQARVEINRAVALRRCSALRAGMASAQRAVQLAKGLPELQAEAYMVLASLLSHEGLLVLAEDAVARAVALSRAGGPKLRGQALTQKGDVLFRAGEFEEARLAFLAAQELAGEARDDHNLVKLEGNIGACLMDLGRRKQARSHFVRAVELARKHTDPASEAFWLVELGRLALEEGHLDEADGYARAALRIAKPAEHDLTIFRAEWLTHLVVVRRRPDDADRHRIAYLNKLYPRVREHRSFDAVREFKAQVLDIVPGTEEPHR